MLFQTDLFSLTDMCGVTAMPIVSQWEVVDELRSSGSLRRVAQSAQAPFVVLITKPVAIVLSERALERMVQAATDSGAVMAYADYWSEAGGERRPHPVIDYQEGSLRDDFDFGSLLLVRTDMLQQWAGERADGPAYDYAGLYDLRLWLSRHGELLHLRELLYTETETDLRASGEKQFDYVNPANREVQVEMERVATEHLRALGALVDTRQLRDVNFYEQDFPVEASVVIPVFNRERTIADAVRSALSQQTTFYYNVIVVDNHSTDRTGEILADLQSLTVGNPACLIPTPYSGRLVVLTPSRHDLGIGGCWNLAVDDPRCGRFAVQLDSDDLYSSPHTLQRIVDTFYEQRAAMVVGSYRMCDFELQTLPPGLIAHREWTDENGPNNALRINGLGAPRAFFTPLLRQFRLPNTSYGEDYAMGLRFSREYRIARIYDELYLCRRWGGNSDSNLSQERINANNLYKDQLRTIELRARRNRTEFDGREPDLSHSGSLQRFFDRQMHVWPEAMARYRDLRLVETRELASCPVNVGNADDAASPMALMAQHNPARIRSTGASITREALSSRPCFLCRNNRPEEQLILTVGAGPVPARNEAGPVPAHSGYDLLVNPFPILPRHYTIVARDHRPQRILPMYATLLELLDRYPELTVFYNGPLCGASAPDHAHLQAGTTGLLPLQREWPRLSQHLTPLATDEAETDALMATIDDYPCAAVLIRTVKDADSERLFRRLYDLLPIPDGEEEPMMNIVAWRNGEERLVVVFPRSKHRPDCYYQADTSFAPADGEDDGQLLVSPGALDMAGLLILPRREDYEKLTAERAIEILKEVSRPVTGLPGGKSPARRRPEVAATPEPTLSVGILSADHLDFHLNGVYQAKGETICGPQTVELVNGSLLWRGQQYQELCFIPIGQRAQAECDCRESVLSHSDSPQLSLPTFTLCGVTIGKGFHWEQQQEQTFEGVLRLMVEGDKLVAVNELPVEDYLASVITSEMSATSQEELLKAHAVISRTWVLCQKQRRAGDAGADPASARGSVGVSPAKVGIIRKEGELLRWYDNGEHTLFDVCADDHCQRYQGIRQCPTTDEAPANGLNPALGEALADDSLFTANYALVQATRGEVLTYGGELCDARFSKCCGGRTEEYQYCWDDTPKPYLRSVADPFCDTHDEQVLRQVLRDYDQPTIPSFYRWTVEYTQEQLSDIVARKTGLDLGTITALVPLDRGESDRIWRLQIVGTKGTFIIGKELEIRRALSESHLLSSAFDVEVIDQPIAPVAADVVSPATADVVSPVAADAASPAAGDAADPSAPTVPVAPSTVFRLHGRGWGHGVGLCQIGAAVMASKGYSYKEILRHYYPGAEITTIY